jgi:hypothetical protein
MYRKVVKRMAKRGMFKAIVMGDEKMIFKIRTNKITGREEFLVHYIEWLWVEGRKVKPLED